jgi:stage IV sporulation protein FB
MERDVPAVPVQGRLEAAVRHLQDGARSVVAVTDASGRLAGYVTSENVGELMMIRRAGSRPTDRKGPLLPQ